MGQRGRASEGARERGQPSDAATEVRLRQEERRGDEDERPDRSGAGTRVLGGEDGAHRVADENDGLSGHCLDVVANARRCSSTV